MEVRPGVTGRQFGIFPSHPRSRLVIEPSGVTRGLSMSSFGTTRIPLRADRPSVVGTQTGGSHRRRSRGAGDKRLGTCVRSSRTTSMGKKLSPEGCQESTPKGQILGSLMIRLLGRTRPTPGHPDQGQKYPVFAPQL